MTGAHSFWLCCCLSAPPTLLRYMKYLCDSCTCCGVQALKNWHHCEFVSHFIMFSKLTLNWQIPFKSWQVLDIQRSVTHPCFSLFMDAWNSVFIFLFLLYRTDYMWWKGLKTLCSYNFTHTRQGFYLKHPFMTSSAVFEHFQHFLFSSAPFFHISYFGKVGIVQMVCTVIMVWLLLLMISHQELLDKRQSGWMFNVFQLFVLIFWLKKFCSRWPRS